MSAEVELPKTYLVVIALAELGGEADLESIAIRAHELFPQVFSWKTRPDLPDKDIVRAHLSEAKKEKFGGLVADVDLRRGRGIKRYALTSTGEAKARELSGAVSRHNVSGSKTTLRYRRIIDPILSSTAFTEYEAGQSFADIGRDSFLESLKLFPDAGDFVITSRLARAQGAAHAMPKSAQKQAVIQYLEQGRHAFDI